MRYLAAFGRFWWNFIVGDDPVLAVGVVIGLCGAAALVASGLNGWWLLPAAAAATLAVSLRRAIRPRKAPSP